MFVLHGKVCWSATDLTHAAGCEFAFVRQLDVHLGRAAPVPAAEDPLLEQIARLGDAYEAHILADLEATTPTLVRMERASTSSADELLELHEDTLKALASSPDVVYQAGFFDGEFHGYADFLLSTDVGWVVTDAKLARQARPKALLQIAAYADQLLEAGVPVAPTAALLLGNGKREDFPVAELLPVFRERRRRLRAIIADRTGPGAEPVARGDESYTACGSCDECAAAADAADDLVLVAGMRMDQRRKLRAAGIRTLDDLAAAEQAPASISSATFAKLQGQAALQHQQREDERASDQDEPGRSHVRFELLETAAETFAQLPEPSSGDLFFDFEGDPLYNEGDLERWGLEYLWGTMAAPAAGETAGEFTPLWAHDSTGERVALAQFLDCVVERRKAHPGMHVYHYAPYETSALKRLVSTYQAHEDELDTLLRDGVFVDLYATVRGTVRVSQPSYSIKKLEPLYMGCELRESSVQAGDQSIAEYHEYRELRDTGQDDAAQERLNALEDYNRYDCLSTLRLRDWLLGRKASLGPTALTSETVEAIGTDTPAGADVGAGAAGPVNDARDAEAALVAELMARSGTGGRAERNVDEQACAMLAASVGYFRREHRPFWWAHFDRMAHPIDDWVGDRDVFRVSSGNVLSDWALHSARARNPRRRVELVGEWSAGSTPGNSACLVFSQPVPPNVEVPVYGLYGYQLGQAVTAESTPSGDVVRYEESRKPDLTYTELPIALVPNSPPRTGEIEAAIAAVASLAINPGAVGGAGAGAGPELPEGPAFDLLRRVPPRLPNGASLPATGNAINDIVDALVALDDSYLAVQGPPGTGKTWTGSRVVRTLVEQHGWRIGVIAQSHAVVENMLDCIVDAGLDPDLVGKSKPRSTNPAWNVVTDSGDGRAAFLTSHAGTGCVLGGTAWTFASDKLVAAGGLDLLIVDEAGQFALAPTVGISRVAARLLLLGDPQQLPQVSQGTHPEPVDHSALGWLLGDHDTLPESHGYFLAKSYRMHPAVCAAVSKLSYDGRLHSAGPPSQRSLEGVTPGVVLVEVDHQDNRTESPEEAVVVVATIEELLGTTWSYPDEAADGDVASRPLDQDDFLVVAPYNAQVNLIRKTLVAAGYADVRVGTVDKFQGQEAPVAIVSMTASSHSDVPRGMGFLLNRNRVNVAISRAMWRAVVVRSAGFTSFMPSTVPGLLELGSFIGLCDDAD
jgi:uncharacterized protein